MIQSATERHSQPGAPRLWPSEPWPGLAASPLSAMPLVPSCALPASNLAAHHDPLWLTPAGSHLRPASPSWSSSLRDVGQEASVAIF